MARLTRAVVTLVMAAFIGLVMDGVFLRDPWVELGFGYNIGAVSWNQPCHLVYWETQDARPPSEWLARRDNDSFTIRNRHEHDRREYDTEEVWNEAIQELNARPSSGSILLDNITGFDRDDRFAIGEGGDGCFLLELPLDNLEVWKARDEWASAVRSRTGLDPDHLKDPTAWHLQYRDSVYWAVMGPYLAAIVLWIVVPLVWRRRVA